MQVEKSISNNCSHITIGGYRAIIDPRKLIIDTDPEIEKLCYRDINEVYAKYKRRAEFKLIEKIPFPVVVTVDRYKQMIETNPAISYLARKFNCEIF